MSNDGFTTPESRESHPLPCKRPRDDDVESSAEDPDASSSPPLTPRRLDMEAAGQTVLACDEKEKEDADGDEVETTQKYETDGPEEGELVEDQGESSTREPVALTRTGSEGL